MLFNSYVFMLAFLPLTLLGYFLLGRLPEKIQLNKVFLVLASFLFYGYNNPSYVPIIAGSILINYALSQLMLTQQKKALRLPLMLLGLFLNLGVLFYFKYHDFFFENLNGAFGLHLTLNHLALPLGISFFTFQQLSYVIDSYKRTVPRYNILDYSLFVTFFPQLIVGPIVLHSEIVPQFADVKNRHFNFDHFAPGLYAFARGLVKKVVIADTFAVAVEAGFADALTLNTAEAWFVAIGYTLQLYFDFSGYCDMATGVGLMFNIEIPINFNSPYKSLNIREFWQRWHVTLSRFLTTYVYFPLGGSRKGLARTCVNLMIVFLLSGLWHGAGWLFLLWGLMHGAASVLYRIFRKPYDGLHPALQWMINFGFIVVAWVFFRATSLADALAIVKAMLTMNFGPLRDSITSAFALPGGFLNKADGVKLTAARTIIAQGRAVQLVHHLAARRLVQTVDVLGHHTGQLPRRLQLLRRLQPLEGLGLGHVHEDGVLAHHHLQRTGERLIDVGAALGYQSHLLQSVEAADGGVAAQLHLRSGGEVADMEAVSAQGLDEGRLGVAQLRRRFPHSLICGELCPLRQQNDTCGVAAEGLPGKCIYDLEFHVLILLPDRSAFCDAAALPAS